MLPERFPSVNRATEYFSNLLKTIPTDEKITNSDILELVLYTPHIELGPDYEIHYSKNKPFGELSLFYITDTRVAFSWKDCIKNMLGRYHPSEPGEIAKTTFRLLVSDQILDFRRRNPVTNCVICDSGSEIQVDHYKKSFSEIRTEFLRKNNLDMQNLITVNKNQRDAKFTDENINLQWKNFHRENATFRYLCKKCNAATFARKI